MTRQRSRDICRSLRAETDRRQKQKKQLKSAQLTEASNSDGPGGGPTRRKVRVQRNESEESSDLMSTFQRLLDACTSINKQPSLKTHTCANLTVFL